MRVLAIIGALLLGLIGLAMSLCGGGFLLTTLVQNLSHNDTVSMIGITTPFIIVGVLCIVGCVVILRRLNHKPPPDGPYG